MCIRDSVHVARVRRGHELRDGAQDARPLDPLALGPEAEPRLEQLHERLSVADEARRVVRRRRRLFRQREQ
eukprot:5127223-Prymnesium_polylepis.1